MKNSTICTIAFLFLMSFSLSSQTVGLKVISSGDVGVGTANPVEKLDVDGAVKLGTTTATNAGTIRFDNDCFQGYDGTSWVDLGGSGCGGSTATCTDGIQNQGETGVDCGGPCAACSGGSCEVFPNMNHSRDLPNELWNNEYNVGGTGISGDGELCWKVNPHVGNTQQIMGLSLDPNVSAAMNTVDFGIHFYIRSTHNIFRVYIRENGTNKGLVVNQGTDVDGSTFCVRRTGTTIEYVMDGTVLYTSTASSTGTLYFDNSFYDRTNSSIWGVRPSSNDYFDVELCPLGTYTMTTPTNESDILPSYDEKINSLENELSRLKEIVSSGSNHELTLEESQIRLKLNDKPGLEQNSPNPFSIDTQISYYIPKMTGAAELTFYNYNGLKIQQIELDHIGYGKVTVDASELPIGLYSYSLVIDGQVVLSNKMSIVR